MKNLFVILGNQLFETKILKDLGCSDVFMAEDFSLCTYEKHHKLKIYLYLCAMREYRSELESENILVHYNLLNERKKNESFLKCLCKFLLKNNISKVNFFEIEDKAFEKEILRGLNDNQIKFQIHQSPMFLFSRKEFDSFAKDKNFLRMVNFYQKARKKFNILMDTNDKPLGGKWSFDQENRKKIPANTSIPSLSVPNISIHHDAVSSLIKLNFNDHPGQLENIWFPVTRKEAESQFQEFIKLRMFNFGIYEDAMLDGKNFLFHSCISSSLNIGLLSPNKVIKQLINSAEKYEIR